MLRAIWELIMAEPKRSLHERLDTQKKSDSLIPHGSGETGIVELTGRRKSPKRLEIHRMARLLLHWIHPEKVLYPALVHL